MPNIIPYIDFAKNGQEAITFYKSVFGGDAQVQVEGERVLHVDFQAGGIHFMGSDLHSDQAGLERANGSWLVLNCDSEEQLREFYARLVNGGTEVFAPTDSGWGAIIAHCTDQFGVTWLMNYDKPQS